MKVVIFFLENGESSIGQQYINISLILLNNNINIVFSLSNLGDVIFMRNES